MLISDLKRIPGTKFYYCYRGVNTDTPFTTVCQNKDIYGGAICNDYLGIRVNWEPVIEDFKWILRMCRRNDRRKKGGLWNKAINRLSYFWYGEYDYLAG